MKCIAIENEGKTNLSDGWPQTETTREQESGHEARQDTRHAPRESEYTKVITVHESELARRLGWRGHLHSKCDDLSSPPQIPLEGEHELLKLSSDFHEETYPHRHISHTHAHK